MEDSSRVMLSKRTIIKWTIIIVFLVGICLFLFYGFTASYFASSKMPFNFPNTKWTCENENMWFIVDGDKGHFYGQRINNGEMQEIDFVIFPGMVAGFYEYEHKDSNDGALWWGDVKYKKDKVILLETDDSCEESIFDETDFPIIFVREDLSEEEIEALKNGR